MIWFTCGKCGKTIGRPENNAGSMVFCECGQGNRVPWESTAAEPPPSVPAMPSYGTPSYGSPPAHSSPNSAPATPTLAPLTFDMPSSYPPNRPEERTRRRGERRDPNYCFNHPDSPQTGVCEDCGEAFCDACLVSLQGAKLCGPCKNFRVRRLELPPRNSGAATTSFVVAAIAASVLGFCLFPMSGYQAVRVVCLLALLPAFLALGLGIRALYLSRFEERPGGQAIATTGITTAAIAIVLTVVISVYGLFA
jgi:hypothetical protein